MSYEWLKDEPKMPAILSMALTKTGVVDAHEVADKRGRKFEPNNGHRPSGAWMYDTAVEAGYDHSWDPMRPKGWCRFGRPVVEDHKEVPGLGDIMAFEAGDNTLVVGVYIGQDSKNYHVVGCTKGLEALISKIPKTKFRWARRGPDIEETQGPRFLTTEGNLKT